MRRSAFIVLLLLAPGMLTFGWYTLALRPLDEQSTVARSVEIPQGMGAQDIGDLLHEEGIVRSALALKAYVRIAGAQAQLKAGTYILKASMSVPDVVDVLTSGVSQEISVTIPEGYTVSQIDAYLAEKGLIDAGALLDCARLCDYSDVDFLPESRAGLADRGGVVEGYLYPDTYFVSPQNFNSDAFIRRMLDTFRRRVLVPHADAIADSGRSLHEIITMASIVEAETRTNDERAMVAGILWKREDVGMMLGADATVRYILDKPVAAITRADLDIDSPYNTRKVRGLPPGPIENPGLPSIVATLSPQSSPYWYYLHGTDGQIRYAETNDEHNTNKQRYL